MNLNEKAMLVNLSISQWTARKEDKKITQEVEQKYNAREAGHFNKVLIAQEEIKKLQKIANEARIFHYENTLPWNDEGSRILPTANYFEYTQKMQTLKQNFENAVRAFIDNYPALVDEAKNRLNGLFKLEDYPPIDKITRKYSLSTQFLPLPDKEDFRVDLQIDEVNTIKAELEARIKETIQKANQDLWERLFKVIKHVSERLHDKEAIFRDSLIKNIIELCQLLPKLNITGDPNLETMRKEIETSICQVTPQELRDDETLRKDTARKADQIMETMSTYFTPATN